MAALAEQLLSLGKDECTTKAGLLNHERTG